LPLWGSVFFCALGAFVVWQGVSIKWSIQPSHSWDYTNRGLVYFAFAGVLIVLSFIDFASMRLPDVITLPAIPVFFLSGFAVHEATWLERLIGTGAGYLFLRIIADFYYYVLKREGLGLGDAKLLALIGALLGWRALLFVLTVGGFAGSLISLPIVIWSRRRQPAKRWKRLLQTWTV